MRISDWSSDVCSSDLQFGRGRGAAERTRTSTGSPASPLAATGGHRGGSARRRALPGLDAVAQAPGAARRRARHPPPAPRTELWIATFHARDRQRVVSGTSVSVRVDLGGRRIIQQKKTYQYIIIYRYT